MSKVHVKASEKSENLSFINDLARRHHLEASVQGSKVVQLEAEISRGLGQKVYVTVEAYRILLNLMSWDDRATHYAAEWDAGAVASIADHIWTSEDIIRQFQGTV